jgi:methyltransferase
VLRTLGERWTTRIIILPGAPPVTSGPYRLVRHPNYLIVAWELPCASLALGLPWHAAVFGVLNLALLARAPATVPLGATARDGWERLVETNES